MLPESPSIPPPRLKILQIFASYLQYGGEEGSVHRIARSLRRRHDIEGFYCSTKEMLNGGPLARLTVPLKAWRNTEVMERLRQAQERGGFDIWLIHNVFPAISPAAYELAAELGIPVVHYLHNYRFGCVNAFLFTKGQDCRKCLEGNFIHGALGKCWRNSYPQSSVMAAMLARVRSRGLFAQVARWIALSEAQKRIHVSMGVPADRIEVVPHFLTVQEEDAIPPFPDDGYGLYIGRLSPEKGVSRLLEAWALLDPERRLVIAGDGPELDALLALKESLGLINVEFRGFIAKDAQGELWEGASFSIVPSLWQEPFGMVVLEAWSKGRPVVALRMGALSEIITDGENGFLAASEEASQLAQAVERAFASIGALPGMGRKGLGLLESYYNEDRWLDDIEKACLMAKAERGGTN